MWIALAIALLPLFGAAAEAQAQTHVCSYFQVNPARSITDTPCTVSAERIMLGDMVVTVKEVARQGQWSKITINQKLGTRFEYDRSTFYLSTDDLSEFLEYRLATGSTSPAPSSAGNDKALTKDCNLVDRRAAAQYRYVLCSAGLYDRKEKDFLFVSDGKTIQSNMDHLVGRGFMRQVGPVPKKFENSIHPIPPDDKVLIWADEIEPIFILKRNVEKRKTYYSMHIVSTRFIDSNGLSIGVKPDAAWNKAFHRSCKWGEGFLTCPVTFIKTNEPSSNFYHAGVSNPKVTNVVEMVEITFSK